MSWSRSRVMRWPSISAARAIQPKDPPTPAPPPFRPPPPLVQAACAYALISLIDPNMYVSSGLLRGFAIKAREGSVLNPRFPAPLNTYNPTVHALVDAIFAAMSHIAPQKVRADC